MIVSGTIVGYDPGGNKRHGVALLLMNNEIIDGIETKTFNTAAEVIRFFKDCKQLIGLGVDTLTCWSTGQSGWRPADRWLREEYKNVRNSVVSPNGLYCSMALNGMIVLLSVRDKNRDIFITETHPKVLYYHLTKQKYNYDKNGKMDRWLSDHLGQPLKTANEDEWDAAFSAYAAFQSLTRAWERDLHQLPTNNNESIVYPCGITFFFWPE